MACPRSDWVSYVVLALSALTLPACGTTERSTYLFEGSTMGSTYSVKIVAEEISPAERARLRRLIENELEGVNRKMSHYREDSELSRFNRSAEPEPFFVSPETFEVFLAAQEISLLTGGAFDVTAAPLIDLWGFGPEKAPDTLPSETEIAKARERTGHDKLVLDPKHRSLRKLEPGVRCDLSAIAKGYAVDRVAVTLDREGYTDYLVEVGGEIRTAGKNDSGEDWRVGIEQPLANQRTLGKIVPLSNLAMATSGGYRNFYEKDGKRYSHTIDPRTGRPVIHELASVTVVDELCMRADALATGLLVLGPEEGYALAVENDVAARFLVVENGGFRERVTPAFEALEKRVQ